MYMGIVGVPEFLSKIPGHDSEDEVDPLLAKAHKVVKNVELDSNASFGFRGARKRMSQLDEILENPRECKGGAKPNEMH